MTPENKVKSQVTFNKDELSFIMSLLLGDGSLAVSGRLVIAHGHSQKDYAEWKADKLSKITNQLIKANQSRQCYQLQFQRKTLKTLRYKVYPNNKKDIVSILGYIKNPLEAIAIWLCDDGNVNPSIATNGKCYSASLQLFTFTELEESIMIADWFEKHTGIRPKLIYMDRSKSNKKSAYKLKWSAEDSRQLYKTVKNYIPNIPSMNYKFRYIEYNISTSSERDSVLESRKDSLTSTVM
jgi:hypothetical protein